VAVKRLHAFPKAGIIILLLIQFVSCPGKGVEKTAEVYPADEDIPITDQYRLETNDAPVPFEGGAFIGTLTPMTKEVFLESLIGARKIISPYGSLFFSGNIIYEYDPELNQFTAKYSMGGPWDSVRKYYIAGDTLAGYTAGTLYAPNTNIPICKNNDFYFAVHREKDNENFQIVKSNDLKTWEPAGFEQRAPIILFDRDNRVYAIMGSEFDGNAASEYIPSPTSEIVEIGTGENGLVTGKTSPMIFEPSNGKYFAHMTEDRDVKAVYIMDDFVFVRTSRVFEGGAADYEFLINTNDLSFSMKSGYNWDDPYVSYVELPVKRKDGWKLYRFMEDKTVVIDPFVSEEADDEILAVPEKSGSF
jgi:hypothetical protein